MLTLTILNNQLVITILAKFSWFYVREDDTNIYFAEFPINKGSLEVFTIPVTKGLPCKINSNGSHNRDPNTSEFNHDPAQVNYREIVPVNLGNKY